MVSAMKTSTELLMPTMDFRISTELRVLLRPSEKTSTTAPSLIRTAASVGLTVTDLLSPEKFFACDLDPLFSASETTYSVL